MSSVHLYGMQRSGTCYWKQLVEKNFDVTIHAKDKHHVFQPGSERDVVIITRNPYSWLPSLHRLWLLRKANPDAWPYAQLDVPEDFNQFVRHRFVTLWPPLGLHGLGGFAFKTPMGYYRHLINNWKKAPSNYLYGNNNINIVPLWVRWEDHLESFADELNRLWLKYSWLRLYEHFQDSKEEAMRGAYRRNKADGTFDRREYYLKEQYMDVYDADTLRFVSERLKPGMMDFLGYEVKT